MVVEPPAPETLGSTNPEPSHLQPQQPAADARVVPAPPLPTWLTAPKNKLPQFLKYIWKVYGLPRQLAAVHDARTRPQIPTVDVVRGLLFGALFRTPSLNALEADLKQPSFQRLLGRRATPGEKAFSADTVARVLDTLEHEGLRKTMAAVILRADRNKVFRDDGYGGRKVVAIDGWEPFNSYLRHCKHCLVRNLQKDGKPVKQYYHAFAVAFLVAPKIDLVLDIEPLRTSDMRRRDGEVTDKHDGEQTAARRLIRRLRETYGAFIDIVVLDALYANGPTMRCLDKVGYGGIITLKKETDEPLKDGLILMAGEQPCAHWSDKEKREHVQVWDVPDIETLDTYPGKVRVLKAEVRCEPDGAVHTWTAGVVGKKAARLSPKTVHTIQRARWHEENTAFCQWTRQWHLTHVFRHTPGAVVAVVLLWCLVFNLLQLFLYRRLRRPRIPLDPCDTIRALVTQMAREVFALLKTVFPWPLLLEPG